jgi:hypothetical protein
VTTGAAPIPKLDVLLVIDVTSSMKSVIAEVTQSAGVIVSGIRELVPDAAFGLATVSDYPTGAGSHDYPWRLDQDLALDDTAVKAALGRIVLQNGGDPAESYLRALYESQFVSWRADSRRIVILFGDSSPHDPDPGRDAQLNTADDLTQQRVLQELTRSQLTVLGVYAKSGAQSFYEGITNRTGGQAFRLDQVSQIPGAVQQLVKATVSRIQVLTLAPGSPGDSWLRWQPEAHRDVGPLTTSEFTLALCVPAGTAGGDYPFDVTVTGDGATLGRIPVLVHVPPPTPTPVPTSTRTVTPSVTPTPSPTATPTPWLGLQGMLGCAPVWPPLLLLFPLLLLLGAWFLSKWRSQSSVSRGKPDSRRGDTGMGGTVKPPTRERAGADITHGRQRPRKRDG